VRDLELLVVYFEYRAPGVGGDRGDGFQQPLR
jgi:hypothetical protein